MYCFVVIGHQAFPTLEALTDIAEVTLKNIGGFEAGQPIVKSYSCISESKVIAHAL